MVSVCVTIRSVGPAVTFPAAESVGQRPAFAGRQHGQQADGDTRRTGVDVDPEGHPRQDDDEDRRYVDLDQEVADVASHLETKLQARVRPCAKHNTAHIQE